MNTFLYTKGDSPGKIRLLALPQKKQWTCEPFTDTLLMVTKGSFTYRVDQQRENRGEWGEILFLSTGAYYVFTARENTEWISLEIPPCEKLVKQFFPSSLSKEKERISGNLPSLSFAPVLWEYTRNLKVLLKETPLSLSLTHSKILELFALMAFSYSQAELINFFHPVIKEEEDFPHFIWNNYKKVKTVEELARLSGNCTTGFENKFKQTFHMPPYKWIMERKKERICYELTHSNLQIQELADKCGFASPSQMNDFCKKHIGLTPGDIRRKRNI